MSAVAATPEEGTLDAEIVCALQSATYEEVAARLQVSRGRVYQAALKFGARKHEARIRARLADRKRLQQEFLQSVLDATTTADVLDFLDGVPDRSVHLHVTSPPYNIGRQYGGAPGADQQRFAYYCGWLMQVCSELARTLVDGGTLFLQVGSTRGADGTGLYPLDCLMFQHLLGMGLTFQSRVAWVLPHGLTPRRRLAERYETALVFTKGPTPRVFNPTPAREPQKQPGKRSFKGPRKGELSGHPLGAWPTNVWPIANAGHNRRDGVEGHPAQMPSELARRAILLYSNAGDLVMDAFSGSGTTHAEAVRTGRAFAGCDLQFEDLRAKRLAGIAPDTVCVLPGVTDASLAVWAAEAVPVRVPAGAAEQLSLVE